MATFSYVAVDDKKSPVNGTIEQLDRASAIDALVKQGLRPISIKEVKSKQSGSGIVSTVARGKVKTDQLVMFTRQLSAMVGAGVPLLRALSALSDHIADSPMLKQILNGVISDVEAGSALGDALAKYPSTFNDVYVNMVRAGEAAGILDDILSRLALQQEKSTAMRKKIKSSMSYPVVLMGITVLAFFGLMFFVVPQIGKVLTDLGGANAKLPTLTLAMLGLSNFIIEYWYLVFGVIGGLVYGILRYIKTPVGKHQFHYLLLKTPLVKTIVMKIAVANFARTFSALMEAGVAVLEALHVTSRSVGNVIYEKALVEAAEEVKLGKSLSAVIESKKIFPPIVAQMLLVGEETGQLPEMLNRIADNYDEEVDNSVGAITSIIEPIMIVFLALVVGTIVIALFLPIIQIIQNLTGG